MSQPSNLKRTALVLIPFASEGGDFFPGTVVALGGVMIGASSCSNAASATSGAAADVDCGSVPRERIEAMLLRSIAGCAVYAMDTTGHVLTWHPDAQRVKGYCAAEIVGQHFSVFYSPEARACGKPERDLLAAAHGPIERADWRLRNDSSWFWAHSVVAPMHGANGRLVGFACVVTDLTERREAEDARLRRAIAEVTARLRDDLVQHARRALDNTLMGVRLHLDSLHAAVRQDAIEVKGGLASRLTLLEWGHCQLANAVDRSLKIVSDTNTKLEKAPERSR